jgi:hypothetical protein
VNKTSFIGQLYDFSTRQLPVFAKANYSKNKTTKYSLGPNLNQALLS